MGVLVDTIVGDSVGAKFGAFGGCCVHNVGVSVGVTVVVVGVPVNTIVGLSVGIMFGVSVGCIDDDVGVSVGAMEIVGAPVNTAVVGVVVGCEGLSVGTTVDVGGDGGGESQSLHRKRHRLL